MFRIILLILLSLFFSTVNAQTEVQPIPVDKAFGLSAQLTDPYNLNVQLDITPGFYLYRNTVKFKLMPESVTHLAPIVLPEGTKKKDELHGEYQAYTGKVTIPLKIINANTILNLGISYQGCSEAGFCYAPVKRYLKVNLAQVKPPVDLTSQITKNGKMPQQKTEAPKDATASVFKDHGFFFIIFTFFGIGLLLAFTPCILPMVPILSGIIVGQGKISTIKAFFLSLSYVVGMALTYAAAGVGVALVGGSIQTALQKPWIIVLFSLFFVLLAFSLFEFYEFRLPSGWQRRITGWSNKQKSGNYIGVFVMGCLASLIVSPCVSAPLVGVLAYIAQTGNVILGGFALLAMGFGMGMPLLLIGTSAGKLLPKSGEWMNSIKKIFGILMIAFAIWMLSRVISGPLSLMLWGILAITTSIFMGIILPVKEKWNKIGRLLADILMIYGIILLIGAAMGNSDPLRPWAGWKIGNYQIAAAEKKLPFIVVKNMQQFDQELVKAELEKKPVLLDFYADWCASCVMIDKHVFSRDETANVLKNFVLLRSDVTENNEFDHALMKRFNVVAPPTIIFFKNSNEIPDSRIVGEVDTKEFIAHIRKTMS